MDIKLTYQALVFIRERKIFSLEELANRLNINSKKAESLINEIMESPVPLKEIDNKYVLLDDK